MKEPAYLNGLNDVLDLLVDSRKGYAEAEARAEDPHVKSLLRLFSDHRQPLIDELEEECRRLNKDHEPSTGTLKGDVHRVWMDIRDGLSGSANANVLRECERGEEYLLSRYDEVMQQKELPVDTWRLLQKQRGTVSTDLAQVRTDRRIMDTLE